MSDKQPLLNTSNNVSRNENDNENKKQHLDNRYVLTDN